MAKAYSPVYYYPTGQTELFQGQVSQGKVFKDIKNVEHSDYGGWWPIFFPTVVGLLVTGNQEQYNVMTVACLTVVNAFPFMVGFPIHAGGASPRGDGPRYSLTLLEENPEFTLNIPHISDEMTKKVMICGSISGRNGIDKFARAGFTPLPSLHVGPPVIKECSQNLECRVHTIVPLESHNWVIGTVDAVYLNEEVADGHSQLLWRSMPELVKNIV